MKKVLFTLLCAFLFSTSIYAVKELVPLTVSIEEDDQQFLVVIDFLATVDDQRIDDIIA